mgnify:CR=1 FL=1
MTQRMNPGKAGQGPYRAASNDVGLRQSAPPDRRMHINQKGTPSKRGYDRDWLRVRDAFARENPRICTWSGCGITLANKLMHVDHIEPFKGLGEPKRLDALNRQWFAGRT